MAKRVCMVILPEGDKGSDIQNRSDDLFELAIARGLEKFDFQVLRAESFNQLSAISPDIVEHVQSAELCLFDLTGSDPAVFYHCGRRHETGKPAIHLNAAGVGSPLLLTGVTAIPFDLSTPRGVQTVSVAIEESIRQLEVHDYAAPSSGATLSTLARAIDRIESKLDRLDASSVKVPDVANSEEWDALELQLMGPEAVHKMIAAGQLEAAVDFVRKSRHRFGVDSFLALAVLPVMAGSFTGFNYLKSIAGEILFDVDHVEEDHVMLIIGALVQYFSVRDEDTGGLQELGQIFVKARERFADNRRLMAFLHIQLSKLQINSGYIEDALINLETASTQYGDRDAARHLAQVKKEFEKQN
ncbi:MAG: hypothetical protein JXX14_05020 [Deltaproteobacteria bacterium]|nr:hypothetical protein [Deltaproteobacteria bacterium]